MSQLQNFKYLAKKKKKSSIPKRNNHSPLQLCLPEDLQSQVEGKHIDKDHVAFRVGMLISFIQTGGHGWPTHPQYLGTIIVGEETDREEREDNAQEVPGFVVDGRSRGGLGGAEKQPREWQPC